MSAEKILAIQAIAKRIKENPPSIEIHKCRKSPKANEYGNTSSDIKSISVSVSKASTEEKAKSARQKNLCPDIAKKLEKL